MSSEFAEARKGSAASVNYFNQEGASTALLGFSKLFFDKHTGKVRDESSIYLAKFHFQPHFMLSQMLIKNSKDFGFESLSFPLGYFQVIELLLKILCAFFPV